LLGGEASSSSEISPSAPTKGEKKIVSHWKGNLTLSLLQDRTVFPRGQIIPQIEPYLTFDAVGNYYPVIFCNEFWVMREHMFPINETVNELTLDMSYEPISMIKFSLYTQMEQSFSMQRDMFGAEEGESEELKHMLLDNHPYILAITFAVSMLHMIFDFLAFKNDIQFWRDRKSLEGLSVRTIYINTISGVIIFLYLLDNETSWMVLFSAGMGMVIDAWKITKAVTVEFTWRGSLPWLKFTDKNSYASKTRRIDEEATKYLSWLLIPLVAGYAIYSLMYETHKSWYSWVVGTLAGCVYTFGFIMMTPQLFINYKLKSVANLPWRTFVYKALNTFIDDLFAFVIRMPTLHRLRVFRDDIVFVVYLYQRWIYPVDNSRLEMAGGEAGQSVNVADLEPQPQAGQAAITDKPSDAKKQD
jgi:hypothetical protein